MNPIEQELMNLIRTSNGPGGRLSKKNLGRTLKELGATMSIGRWLTIIVFFNLIFLMFVMLLPPALIQILNYSYPTRFTDALQDNTYATWVAYEEAVLTLLVVFSVATAVMGLIHIGLVAIYFTAFSKTVERLKGYYTVCNGVVKMIFILFGVGVVIVGGVSGFSTITCADTDELSIFIQLHGHKDLVVVNATTTPSPVAVANAFYQGVISTNVMMFIGKVMEARFMSVIDPDLLKTMTRPQILAALEKALDRCSAFHTYTGFVSMVIFGLILLVIIGYIIKTVKENKPYNSYMAKYVRTETEDEESFETDTLWEAEGATTKQPFTLSI